MTPVITLYVDPDRPDILVFIAPGPVHYYHYRGPAQKDSEANTAEYVNELMEYGLDDASIDHYRTTRGYVSKHRERHEVIKLVCDRISHDMGRDETLPVEIEEMDLSHHVRPASALAA